MCDLFDRFVFKSCVFRLKPSNVAYKHASLVPRENDVREHKIFVGKIIMNLCWAYSLLFRVFSRRQGLLKSLQWTLAVSSVLVFIKITPITRNTCALSVSYWEASSKTFTLANSAMPTHLRHSFIVFFFPCLPFYQTRSMKLLFCPSLESPRRFTFPRLRYENRLCWGVQTSKVRDWPHNYLPQGDKNHLHNPNLR